MEKIETIQEMLKEITVDLKSLVEINKAQTEKLIENSQMINRLFSKHFALEKAVYATLSIAQKEQFNTVYESAIREAV